MESKKSNISIVLITGGILVIIIALIYLFLFSAGARYNKMISKADSHFVSNRFDEARDLYNSALGLKPTEEYPREQLAKIDSIRRVHDFKMRYHKALAFADSLFVVKNYEDAKIRYLEAAKLNPDDNYPVEQIIKIDDLLAKMIEKEEEKKPSGNFHIVVGVFENESNADNMMRKMKEKGLNPRIIPRTEFRMQAVTYNSYPTIHAAYNNLRKVQQEIDEDAWVIWHRFK